MADDIEPRRIGRFWLWPDGTTLPVISGGADDDPPDDPPDDPDDPPDEPEDKVDWKAMARKHEREAKRTAAELDKVRKANQSDQEKAIDAAKDEGRRTALGEAGQRLAAAEIKAALAGIVPDPKAIVEDLNLAKYVNDEGEIDEDAVKALREKYAALNGRKKQSFDGGAKDKDAPSGGSFLSQAIRDRLTV